MPTRRTFLYSSVAAAAVGACRLTDRSTPSGLSPAEPIIDIHQHLPFLGRTGDELLAHQQRLGVTHTVLLPLPPRVVRPSTFMGKAAWEDIGPNPTALEFARRHPGQVWFFANEVPDLPEARRELERYLKQGAKGIGEVKFNLECDAEPIQRLAELAGEYEVPLLMHFSREGYNVPVSRFYKMLDKYPRVTFIGHARLFWANIDKNCDQVTDYPKTPVTPGGLTDQYLSDYPNLYADISAGSGLNALTRDEGHARWFLEKHQDRIVFGSDCPDREARGAECDGANILTALRRLCPTKAVERKILFENAKHLLRIPHT